MHLGLADCALVSLGLAIKACVLRFYSLDGFNHDE